jgi:hypothetical protein
MFAPASAFRLQGNYKSQCRKINLIFKLRQGASMGSNCWSDGLMFCRKKCGNILQRRPELIVCIIRRNFFFMQMIFIIGLVTSFHSVAACLLMYSLYILHTIALFMRVTSVQIMAACLLMYSLCLHTRCIRSL